MDGEIHEQLTTLRTLLQEERDAQRLVATIPPALQRLRALYPANRRAFHPDDIRFLQRVARVVEAAEDFHDLAEDLPDVRGDGDVVSYLDALCDLLIPLSGTALELRIRREIRTLQQRSPGAAARMKADARVHRLRALETRAWPCRCGAVMTLRESQGGGLFWGCSTFPRCQYTHQITDKQHAFLDGGA